MTATGAAETITTQVAVFSPSVVFTVMMAAPTVFAVTLPLWSTAAMPVLLLLQVTLGSVALGGATVAYSVSAPPTARTMDVLLSVTPVTG